MSIFRATEVLYERISRFFPSRSITEITCNGSTDVPATIKPGIFTKPVGFHSVPVKNRVPGYHRVILLLITLMMVSGIMVQCVCAADPPVADFTPDCGGVSDSGGILVAFFDNSTGFVDTYAWNFGDGTHSTEENPAKIYAAEGNYTITHTVRNTTSGYWDTITRAFATTCPVPLVVDFSAVPQSGVLPLVVQFNDATSAGDPANNTYLWKFGDGGTSGEINPNHTYTTSGTFTVNLTVTELSGNKATISKPYYIHIAETVNATDFSGTPRCGLSPLPVQFIDESILAHNQWEWNFGDGGTANLSDPLYTYNGEGDWNVSLYISNTSGGPQSLISTTGFIRVIPAGVASFSAAGTIDNTTLSVQFNDTSTGFTSPVTYLLDFGDGTTSAEQNPSHTYADASLSYPATFTVTGYCGQTGTITQTITVSAGSVVLIPPSAPGAPVADFTGTPTSGAAPLDVTFTDVSTNSPTTWSWTFGDGNSSTVRNPVYTYASNGTYTVSLTATNPRGSSTKTRTEYITVSGFQKAPLQGPVDFTGTPTYGSVPLTVQFTAFTTGFKEPESYLWDFGDGGTSTVRNASHTYTTTGYHTVSLTVTGSDGYAETMVKTGYINTELPMIELILGQEPVDASLPSNESALPTQTFQAQSLPMAKSGLQAQSLPMMQSSVPDIPGYQDQSIPQDVSPQNVLSADNVIRKNIEITNWTLKSGNNPLPDAFWMQVTSTHAWKVDVYDALNSDKPQPAGHMAEYRTSGYVAGGKSLDDHLHLKSSGNPDEISLSAAHDPIQESPGGAPGQNKFYITLRQFIGTSDTPLPTGESYHIVITFEATNTGW